MNAMGIVNISPRLSFGRSIRRLALIYLCHALMASTFLTSSLALPGVVNTSGHKDQKAMDAYELQKIHEYSQYRPENAVEDAALDIEHGLVKLFYLDVEEVPELLAIEEEPAKLPKSKHVSIGVGCIDTIHAEDCSMEYREAMQNALSYGVRYNQAIAGHFKLKLKSEPDLLPSETLEFLGLPAGWKDIQMELKDVQPLFGGRDVWVNGSGKAFVRVVQSDVKGLQEHIYRLTLNRGDIVRIIMSFLAKDLITLVMPEQSAPPDHGRPEIGIINAHGRRHALSAWDPPIAGGDPVAAQRFRTVYQEFLRLEVLARETASPLYTGAYDGDTVWEKFLKE
jgi:hypothetical protein